MLEVAMVIFTVLLVFYTYNLGRIAVFDKRYKVYEYLLGFVNTIKRFDDQYVDEIIRINEDYYSNGLNALQKYDIRSKEYKLNFGDVYDKFIFGIESSRFLYKEDIFAFLATVKKNAKVAQEYIEEIFRTSQKNIHKENEFKLALQYFNEITIDQIVSIFEPYLQFEENIFKQLIKMLCTKCGFPKKIS